MLTYMDMLCCFRTERPWTEAHDFQFYGLMQPQALAAGVQRIDVGVWTHAAWFDALAPAMSPNSAFFLHLGRDCPSQAGIRDCSNLDSTLAGTDLTGREEYLRGI